MNKKYNIELTIKDEKGKVLDKKELGKETYYDICKELAKEHIQNQMREYGIEEKEIEKYTKFMDCVESEKS